MGDDRGEISASGGQVWSYNGQAGEMLTLLVTADHPANNAPDRTGLLDTVVTVRSPDGQVLNQGTTSIRDYHQFAHRRADAARHQSLPRSKCAVGTMPAAAGTAGP